MNEPKKRFLRLPDDPDETSAALERAQTIDPDAKLHPLPPPEGPHLEIADANAEMFAKMGVENPVEQKFKFKP